MIAKKSVLFFFDLLDPNNFQSILDFFACLQVFSVFFFLVKGLFIYWQWYSRIRSCFIEFSRCRRTALVEIERLWWLPAAMVIVLLALLLVKVNSPHNSPSLFQRTIDQRMASLVAYINPAWNSLFWRTSSESIF